MKSGNGKPGALAWKPWHQVVTLREDVRTGALSLTEFAADLHDVMMQRGTRPIYEDPARFFALDPLMAQNLLPFTNKLFVKQRVLQHTEIFIELLNHKK